MNQEKKHITELEAQERLVRILNDSPSVVKLAKTEWQITALKPGTQWLIAEEVVKIQKVENANFSDVIKQLTHHLPSLWHILTLVLLNDRNRIFEDEKHRVYSEEYETIYTLIKWETKPEEWLGLIVEVLQMIDVEVFFYTIKMADTIRTMTLTRKMTVTERKQSSQEQSTDK